MNELAHCRLSRAQERNPEVGVGFEGGGIRGQAAMETAVEPVRQTFDMAVGFLEFGTGDPEQAIRAATLKSLVVSGLGRPFLKITRVRPSWPGTSIVVDCFCRVKPANALEVVIFLGVVKMEMIDRVKAHRQVLTSVSNELRRSPFGKPHQ